MTQDEVYGDLLTRFFEINDYPDLAWMHHIACKRYGQAASALITVDTRSTELGQKHVSCGPSTSIQADNQLVSSIGKLAAVADIKSGGDTSQSKKWLHGASRSVSDPTGS
jgi:nuclear pore complex protein Nup133